MNVVQYQPSGAEMALAQGWATANSYGTVLTPWTLDTDSLSFTVPSSGGRREHPVRLRERACSRASRRRRGRLTGAGAATPAATVDGQAPTPAGVPAAGVSPLLLIGARGGRVLPVLQEAVSARCTQRSELLRDGSRGGVGADVSARARRVARAWGRR